MKKVVAFIGSPRKNANTATIVGEIIRGATEVGAEAKVYNLSDMNIKGCQSCFYCRQADTCAIKDDMQAVYEDIKEADSVIIGSPVYMLQVTAQTKTLFDRLFPLMSSQFTPRFGIKKTIMVYSQGNPNENAFKQSFEQNANLLKIMGLDVIDTIISISSNDPQVAKNNDKLMLEAFNAGKELVK